MQFLGATYFGVIFNIWQSILYCCELYTVYKYSQAAAAASTSVACKEKSDFKYTVKAFFSLLNTILYVLQRSLDWFCSFFYFWTTQQNNSILLRGYLFQQKGKTAHT